MFGKGFSTRVFSDWLERAAGGGWLGYVTVMMAHQMEARRSHLSGRGNAFHCAFPSGAAGTGRLVV